jgi:hypothetical protein
MLARPPTIVDKALAAVDGEWRTVREIFATVDEGAEGSVRDALIRLAGAGRVDMILIRQEELRATVCCRPMPMLPLFLGSFA